MTPNRAHQWEPWLHEQAILILWLGIVPINVVEARLCAVKIITRRDPLAGDSPMGNMTWWKRRSPVIFRRA